MALTSDKVKAKELRKGNDISKVISTKPGEESTLVYLESQFPTAE